MGGAAAGWLLLMAAELGGLGLPSGDSSRPRICSPAPVVPSDVARRGPWDRVREQPFESLCLGLSRGQIRLARDPAGALELSRRLAHEWPARPEPRVLEARAMVAADRFWESHGLIIPRTEALLEASAAWLQESLQPRRAVAA